jgi:hypothetical protein
MTVRDGPESALLVHSVHVVSQSGRDHWTGELIVFVEIIGVISVIRVGGVFAANFNYFLDKIYAYDLVTKTDRSVEFSIDAPIFETQDWRKVGLGTGDADALRAHFSAALAALAEIYYRQRLTSAAEDPPV